MHDFLENLLGAKIADSNIQVGLKLLLALLVLLIGLWLVARLANLVQRALQRASVYVTLIGFLRKVVYGRLIAVLAVIVLNMTCVSTALLVTAVGAAGLAIGLALAGLAEQPGVGRAAGNVPAVSGRCFCLCRR